MQPRNRQPMSQSQFLRSEGRKEEKFKIRKEVEAYFEAVEVNGGEKRRRKPPPLRRQGWVEVCGRNSGGGNRGSNCMHMFVYSNKLKTHSVCTLLERLCVLYVLKVFCRSFGRKRISNFGLSNF